ncbi:DUF3696 domain-containing protein [Actinophytocola glycyrrhizae]|uniref:DUF3696 domain-containing protein n=1 Tax=Actinophytocola glycyrrhizae TaxID=2044873 RepID=A0ABV9S0A9_9PSEU
MIEQLHVTNFKAFASAKIALAPYTLLSGLNSTGKSTVLQAIALLRQSQEALTEHDGGLLLNGDLVELGTGQDVLHENYVSEHAEPTISISVRTDSDSYSWSARYEREADLLKLISSADLGNLSSIFGTGFQYLRADRITPAVTYPRSHDIAIRRGFLGARGEHTINYLRHFQDEPVKDRRLQHPHARSRRLLDQAEAWMQDICPGVNLQADAVESTDLVRLSFRFGTAGLSSSNRYRPTNVGFGLTYVLPVIVACLTARPGGLILLENPEAHLHPRGQTAMAALTCAATAAGAQVIVETHSDHVLNGARLSVKRGLIHSNDILLHFFRRGDNGATEIVSPDVGPDGMVSEWPEGFFDEWDRQLDQLLD